MNTVPLPSDKAARWPLIAMLVGASGLALYFIWANAIPYLTYDPTVFTADFWPRRFGLLPHLTGGGIAITAGVVQLWLGLTGRTGRLHRNLGRFYLGGVLVGSLGGFYLSFTAVNPPGWTYRAGLFFLTCAWSATTAIAYLAIRSGKVGQHREWMIRSYIVTFAFVTFRLLDRVLDAWGIGPDADRANFLIWACWSVPLLAASVASGYARLGRDRA